MNNKEILAKIKQHTPSFLGHEQFSKYSVLVPLLHVNGEVHILFEIRADNLRRQPGEICFPGGKIDAEDKSEKFAAIRETSEELGIASTMIEDVYPLDFLLSPFGMIVYPYVGFLTNLESVQPNQSEVKEIFTVPLSYFHKNEPKIYKVHSKLEPEPSFPFELIPGGKNYNWRTRQIDEYFYLYEDKVIWGLTARILSHFIDVMKQR
ncbi:NUDIX hydrolase [Bacillus weihaiensis]|uniref:NUDIX hydrolase n=1 Tax=Bacillus weihaiensis TaxID=1547283 RepID=UPI002354C790|nr:CoA pyrophosphatase [Bacillus weihaiensis]